MLQGKLLAIPDISWGLVDVRDVASLHLLATTKPEAKVQRYSCVTGTGESVTFAEIGGILRAGLGSKASKAPTKTMPNVLVKIISNVMLQLKTITLELGKRNGHSNEKAKSLGWRPRPKEEAIVSCGQALIDAGTCK